MGYVPVDRSPKGRKMIAEKNWRQTMPEDEDIGTFVPVILPETVLVASSGEKAPAEEIDQSGVIHVPPSELSGPTEPWWATIGVVICAVIGFACLALALATI